MSADWFLNIGACTFGILVVLACLYLTIRGTLTYRLFLGLMPGTLALTTIAIMYGEAGEIRHWQVFPLYLLPAAALFAINFIFVGRGLVRDVSLVSDKLRDMSEHECDLAGRLNVTSSDELGGLANWFDRFIEKTDVTIKRVIADIAKVAAFNKELAGFAVSLARGAEAQTHSTAQIAAAMSEMTSTVAVISENSHSSATQAQQSATHAREGGEVVTRAVEELRQFTAAIDAVAGKMVALNKRSSEIGQIVVVIDEIAA